MITNHFCKCDKCGTTKSFENRPFDEILAVVRRAGWRVTKSPTGWRHYCAACVAKWKKLKDLATVTPSAKFSQPPRRHWLPYNDD